MLGKIRWDYTPLPPMPARIRLTTDLANAVAAPSPARALQQHLEIRTSLIAEAEKWSSRRRLAFLITSASMLWLAVLSAGTGVVHTVA